MVGLVELVGAVVPNPGPASDPQITHAASTVFSLIRLVGMLVAAGCGLAGVGMLALGNRGGNQAWSTSGKQLIVGSVAALVGLPIFIPIVNRFFT
jgi:hypothetical protein